MAEYTVQPIYNCRNCQNPIALWDDLLTKKFKNWTCISVLSCNERDSGTERDKQLMTGHFTIADIYCSNCGEVLGWKYVRAYDFIQKYKEGKFIVEIAKIAKLY